MELTEKEKRDRGLMKFEELKGEARKAAYERFARDFVNNKWLNKTEEEILEILSKHWFDENGATFLGTC
jgi:hypothetical protein